MNLMRRLVRHFGCVVAVGWCASGCLDPLIEDPSATGSDVLPAPPDGPSYEGVETDSSGDSDAGTSSGATSDGGDPAIVRILDTTDAASNADAAAADGGKPSFDVDAGADAGETVSTSDNRADASASTSAP